RNEPGITVILDGGSTDLGTDIRELLVDVPGGEVVYLEWEELEWVEFGPAPAGARSRSPRLYGTVEDHRGNRYTGQIAWDNDEVLASDTLEGEETLGRQREILFSEIGSIEKSVSGARVTLTDGEVVELRGSNDVDYDNRGILVADPDLGIVTLEWEVFDHVRFHPLEGEGASSGNGFRAFDGGHGLRGTVVTEDGSELTGRIRWDADEEASWELLDGDRNGVAFEVEFGKIALIEKASRESARVTLLDGRVLELEGSNDVDRDNKGILVKPEEGGPTSATGEPVWIKVEWADFREVRFDHGGGS
ncbi:hypothetical protein ACFL5A_04770, partial [Gemmatimonadota bacterium]